MGVVVFDSDVLIGFLNSGDVQHEEAVTWLRDAMTMRTRRMLCAVNYSEILIGPVEAGTEEVVAGMLARFRVEIITVDRALAERAAAVRARTKLKLPDAYALATCVHAEHRGFDDVRLATFDEKVQKAHAALHSA